MSARDSWESRGAWTRKLTHARIVDQKVQLAVGNLARCFGSCFDGLGVLHVQMQRLDPQRLEVLELGEVAARGENADAVPVELLREGIAYASFATAGDECRFLWGHGNVDVWALGDCLDRGVV